MQTVISKDGTRIAMEKSGSGPALVLVGGALSDRSAAAALRPHLDPHFTVHAYDRRGRGDSDDRKPYSPEREDEDLVAVLAAVGAPVFVYGHSSGGILALRAAIAGVHLRALAVYEPPLLLPRFRAPFHIDVIARLDALVAAGDRDAALRVFLGEAVGLPGPAIQQMSAAPMWRQMLALAHTTPYDATLSQTSALLAPSFPTVLVRTLALHGDASFPWIMETANSVAAAIPNGTSASLPGQTHSPSPGLISSELVRFFLE